jgi:flavin reductase
MAFDTREQRRIMGKFATGVTVVGTNTQSGPSTPATSTSGTSANGTWGMTANAVTSLSLDPPLVLVAVEKTGQTGPYLKQSGCFSLSILAADQEAISQRFAGKGPRDFSGLATKTAVTGAPILRNCLGYVDCRVVEILPGGDHDIFIGEIVAGEARDGAPLVFYAGKYGRLA